MIVGIGIDIVEIKRIENIFTRFGKQFLRRILAEDEMAYAPERLPQWLAGRFAAKEAAVKALGTGFSCGILPTQIIVAATEPGKPELGFTGAALERARLLGVDKRHVSISHERSLAIAEVILENTSQ